MTIGLLAPGTQIHDRYEIVRQIGRGGMGAVYEARDVRLGNQVALKQLLVQGDELANAFAREARLLSSLRHPALPVVSDYFAEDAGRFLVMQFIPGDDLAALLAERGAPFSLGEVTPWAEQLLDALDYLHTQTPPIIHRDVKPQNVKLTPRGEVVLLDFGLAKGGNAAADALAGASVFGYTPQFAPLEQIRGDGTDPRSDLYSLAATLYALLTNTTPLNALERANALLQGAPDPLPPADRLNPLVPSTISDLLQRCMALNVAERPTDAAAMRSAWRAALETGSGATVFDQAPTQVQRAPAVGATVQMPRPTPAPEPSVDRGSTASRGPGCLLGGIALLGLVLLLAVGSALFAVSRALNTPANPAPQAATALAALPTVALPTIVPPVVPTLGDVQLPDVQATTTAVGDLVSQIQTDVAQTVVAVTNPDPATTDSALATVLLDFGAEGRGDGFFDDPRSIAIGPDGAIYVADYSSGRVQRFTAEGRFDRRWLVADERPIFALVADRQDRVYVVQAAQVSIYNGATGELLGGFQDTAGDGFTDLLLLGDGTFLAITLFGDIVRLDANGNQTSRLADPIRELAGSDGRPGRLAADGFGTLYVLDDQGAYVYTFSPAGRYIDRFSVRDPSAFTGIAVDGQGRIYVGDFWGNIQVFDPDGNPLGQIELSGSARDLTFDTTNNLYAVTIAPRVVKFAVTAPGR